MAGGRDKKVEEGDREGEEGDSKLSGGLVEWLGESAARSRGGDRAGFPLAPIIWTLHLYRYFS